MAFDFQQGDTNTLLLTVLRLSGTIPLFPADYSTPKVRVIHVNGGGEVEDLAFINMGQIDGSNNWFHKFDIPITAPFKKFLVIFETVIEGVTTQATEEFRVTVATGLAGGGGAFAVTLALQSSVTMQPIANASIRIFDKATPTVAIASVETDSQGKATVFLDAGTYLAEFTKTGVISEVHDLIVNSDGSHTVVGN